ncbi:matrix protein 2, partial [Influenza A virus (A/northern pintail/Alaska/44183-067/2006(H3N8))]
PTRSGWECKCSDSS